MKEHRIIRLTEKIMAYSEGSIAYKAAYDFADRYYRYIPLWARILIPVDTDYVAQEAARRLQNNAVSLEELDENDALPSLPTWEYIYYLKIALTRNLIPGCRYSLLKCKNNRLCLYTEYNRWILAYIKEWSQINPHSFPLWQVWGAVFAFIDMLTENEDKREKIKGDFGTDANWAEKMEEPLVPVHITDNE